MKNITKIFFWIAALLLSNFNTICADVIITELMPCNTSTYINELYDYVGYAELYNDSEEDVDLRGCTFVNQKKKGEVKWSWTIKKISVLKPKEYRLFFFDEVSNKAYHVGYKIDTDGGVLALTRNDSTISSMKYGQQYPHLSYGIDSTGTLGYMEPSPNASNSTAYKSIGSRCEKPQFSVDPGVKSGTFKLELSSPTDGSVVYYTTNGNIPDAETGKKYSSPISINATTVVRAIAVKDGLLKSEMATGSYIYSDAAHNKCNGLTSNIVSIVTDRKFYYDDMQGIYVVGKNGTIMNCITQDVNYAQDWTRAANFEYIVDGSVVVSQEVETSIKGGCSRKNDTKSLGIKSNKKSGKKGFDYVFFPEQRPGIEYSSLHLRNGGNAYSSICFRDGYMSSLANALGLDCQSYEPVAAYINGKYMGMMGLRSPSNKSYVETHYGLDEDEIDFIEFSQEVDVMAGDTVVYNKMISSLRNESPSSEDYYSNAGQYMEMENFMDYQIFEQFIGNTDWPGNNQKLWRERNGGKFRWILYDLDFGLGLYSNNLSKTNTNMLEYVLGNPKGNWNIEPWMISPFAELIKNDEFKYRFLIRFMHHLKYSFSESMIDSVWESISDKVADEYCAYKNKNAETDFKTLRTFALQRPAYVYQHLKSYYKAGEKVNLQIAVKDVDGNLIPNSAISVNNEALGLTDYSVCYYASIPLKVDVKAPAGYKFKQWTFSSKVTEATEESSLHFEGKLSADMKMTAVFVKESDPKPLTLQVNEICSSNNSVGGNPDESGHYSDWVEIHNYGKEDVDLAGMYITDDSLNKVKYMFPYGSPETKVEAGKYVIVWADDEPWRGPLHTNFKISASGSFIGLTYNKQGDVVNLDSVKCPRLSANYTYGRIGDGDKWSIFSNVENPKVTFGTKNDTLPVDTTVVIPTDTTVAIPSDTTVVIPTDTTEVIPTDTTVLIPTDTTEVIPTDTTVVIPTDTTEVIPTDTTVVIPTDTTEVIPTDTTVVIPTDTTVVIPTDTTVVIPTDTTVVIPTDTTVVIPTDTTVVIPTDTTVVIPTDTTVVIPTDTTVVIPTDTTVVIPTDTTVVIPTDTTVVIPTDTTVVIPTDTTVVIPTDTTVVIPTDTTVVIPTDTTVVIPTDTTVVIPTDTTVVIPTDTTEVMPTDTTVVIPTDTTEVIPTDTTEVIPTDTTVVIPTDTTEVIPTDTTVVIPTDTTVVIPTDTTVVIPTDTTVVIPTDTTVVIPTDTTTKPDLGGITSLDQFESNGAAIKVYPNPVYNDITVMSESMDVKIGSLFVYNVQGVQLLTVSGIETSKYTFNVGNLKPGIYILMVEANGIVVHKRFEKR